MVNHTYTQTIKKTRKLSFYFTLIALVICNVTFSQETYKDSITSKVKKINDYEKVLKDEIYITGKVIESESLVPVTNATISIDDLEISANTDSNGLYKINISDISKSADSLVLKYEAKGYKATHKSIEKTQLTNMFNIIDITMESNMPRIVERQERSEKKRTNTRTGIK